MDVGRYILRIDEYIFVFWIKPSKTVYKYIDGYIQSKPYNMDITCMKILMAELHLI